MLKFTILLLIVATLYQSGVECGRKKLPTSEEVQKRDRKHLEEALVELAVQLQSNTKYQISNLDGSAGFTGKLLSSIHHLHSRTISSLKDILVENSKCIDFLTTMGSPLGAVSVQPINKNLDKAEALKIINRYATLNTELNEKMILEIQTVDKSASKMIDILNNTRRTIEEFTEKVTNGFYKSISDEKFRIDSDDVQQTLSSINSSLSEQFKLTSQALGSFEFRRDQIAIVLEMDKSESSFLKNQFKCSISGVPNNGQYLSERMLNGFNKKLKKFKAELSELGNNSLKIDNNPENLKRIQEGVKDAVSRITSYYTIQLTREKELFQRLGEVLSS